MIQFAVEKANRVLVIAHIDPDGDAIGSLTATGQALQQLGKRVTLACDDSVPQRFHYLPLAGDVRRAPNPDANYDLVVAVDCADESRMGWAYACLPEPKPTLANIDHHITNTRFAHTNLVVGSAVATCAILAASLEQWGLPITRPAAEALLTGIVTDTMTDDAVENLNTWLPPGGKVAKGDALDGVLREFVRR